MFSIIAELSSNHERSIKKAEELILAASRGGATHVKVQYFDPEKLYPTGHLRERAKVQAWDVRDFYRLMEVSNNLGLVFGASVFHPGLVTEVRGLDFIKVASSAIRYEKLHRTVAELFPREIVVSVPGRKKIDDLLEWYKDRLDDLTILVCATQYPVPTWDCGVRRVKVLAEEYPDVRFGYSDHTKSVEVGALVVALGGVAIEKHLRLKNTYYTPDAQVSITPDEFFRMVQHIRNAIDCLTLSAPIEGEGERILQDEQGRRHVWETREVEG